MDFQHKKRSSTSSQRSAQSHKKIVETSTIFSSLSPSCLVSPQGVPEQSEGKINQYHILRDIGSGAYGRVVLCRSEHDQRYYACKIVSKNRLRKKLMWSAMAPPGAGPCQSPGCPNGYMEAIKREIAILKKLSKHPNINNLVEVLDDEKEDSLYMIFELCEYGPIMHLPVRGSVRPMEEPVARQYFRDAVLGLEYLHYKRIIHRDIKPENLLRRASLDSQLGIVQIADFGISTMFEDEVDDPVLDDKNASPLFTAPEACQCDVQHVRGYPLDIWALGVTLYSMVHGRTPWQEESIVLLYDKILNAPAMIGEHLTPPLQDLLQQMLMKDPDERITLSAIKEHPWVTCNGEDPMLPTNENCVFEEVTEEEVQNAFKPAMVFVTKVNITNYVG
ncbi:kinase-like domain-containing protein [Gaertneriomyces semiglobifer]|nr:kinase-like domain-containing protein [Gaertneriomyces semiglobifer]